VHLNHLTSSPTLIPALTVAFTRHNPGLSWLELIKVHSCRFIF